MTAGAPWSVKGIDPKAREVAKDHARRSGLTLGEWLNKVILEDDVPLRAVAGERAYAGGERARPYLEPLFDAESDDPGQIAHALERLTDRIEASETRTGLAISGVEHSVREAVARIDAAEREALAVVVRTEGGMERAAAEQARLVERLRQMEAEASGPRSSEALRAIEQAVNRTANQVFDLEARLARAEATPGGTAGEAVLQQLGERLASAEGHTVDALEDLRRSLAGLDDRLQTVEGGNKDSNRRFETLAQALSVEVKAARTQVTERLQKVEDGGRFDERFDQLSAEVDAAERRAQAAVDEMGRKFMAMADGLSTRLEASDARNAEAIAQAGGEMSRVANAMEARLGQAEQAQAEALEKLGAELGRITDKLSDRLLVSERRAAEAIDDVGAQVARISERMTESQGRAAEELSQQIRQSEARTAQLLEDTGARLERKLDEPAGPASPAAGALEAHHPFAPELQAPEPRIVAPEPKIEAPAPPEPSSAAFGPELFLRAEETEDDGELDLVEALRAPPPFQPSRFESASDFAPIPEVEEDLFGLEQPEPPEGAEVDPTLSTRDVIEQARAAARAAGPERKAGAAQTKGRSWSAAGLFGIRPRRGPSSTLQTAIMVAGGAAFLSVGAAGVVLMQAPGKPIEQAPAMTPRAAVALAPQALASAGTSDPAGALANAYGAAARDVQAGRAGGLSKLKAVADAGYAPAQLYLGKLYETGGKGVKADLVEARRWTARAAESGDAAAMHNLAMFAFRGEGGAQDLDLAARWFRAAATRGIVDSQYNLGLLYRSGSGVPKDEAQAYVWFLAAASRGDAQAKANAAALRHDLTPAQLDAAQRAVDELSRAHPEGVAAQAATTVDPQTLRAAQKVLGRLGYDAGPPMGSMTPALRSALNSYQRDHGLPMTGQLDDATADRLAVFDR